MIPSTRRRSTRTRKLSPEFLARVLLTAIVLVAVSMVALIVSVAGRGSTQGEQARMTLTGGRLEQASLDGPGRAARSIFKHSVIPGGVFTPEELRSALAQDAVAAVHYQGLNAHALRSETVKQDRVAYVSYRKDDQIYWTRNKVRVSQGETILTDGETQVRARCGNCISETPRFPVADVEPDVAELDRLVDDPVNQHDPSLSAAIRAALESALFGAGGTAGPSTARASGKGSPNAGGAGAAGSGMSGSAGTSGGSSAGSRAAALEEPVRSAALADSAGSAVDPGAVPIGGGRRLPDPGAEASGPSSDRPADSGQDAPVGSPAASPAFNPTESTTPSQALLPAENSSLLPAENSLGSPTAGGVVPPGIDLPPGLDPANPVLPLAAQPTPSVADSGEEHQETKAEVASLPEPGAVLLLGGGAAAALLRRHRAAQRSR